MDCTVYIMQSLSFGELHLENDHLVIASGNRPSRFSTSWWAWTEFSNFSHSEFLQPKQITSPAESPESPVIFFSKISPTCQAASWSNGRTCLLLNLLIRLDSSSSRLFAFQTHEIQTNWLIRMSNRIRKSLKLCTILMPVMLTNAADCWTSTWIFEGFTEWISLQKSRSSLIRLLIHSGTSSAFQTDLSN